VRTVGFRSRWAGIAFAAAGIFLFSPGCSRFPFPAPTPSLTVPPTATVTLTVTASSTASPTPTVTRTPTRTVTPTIPYPDWPVVDSEDFESDNGGWDTGKKSNEYAVTDLSITGGKYIVKITSIRPVFWYNKIEVDDFVDFYVATEVQSMNAPANANYGLVFRYHQGALYYFYINAPAKKYGVDLYYRNVWGKIIFGKDSNQINPAGSNQLAVLAYGSDFTLFLNGAQVDAFHDETVEAGVAGIGCNLFEAGEYLQLAFDDFIARALR
jgi:hypothetical protein